MKKPLALIGVAVSLLFITACGSTDEVNNEKDKENVGEVDVEGELEEDVIEIKDDPVEATAPGAVQPSEQLYNEEISFQQVNWIGGAPSIHDEAGLWIYTKENHPGTIADNFNWEEEDVLEWQISNEEFFKYRMRTKALEIVDDNVVKIVVEVGEEELTERRRERRNQNFLIVERGALEGKSFIIETTDGIALRLQNE